MSAIYDNWERLVRAVVRREEIWQLCHADSISTSTTSSYLANSTSTSFYWPDPSISAGVSAYSSVTGDDDDDDDDDDGVTTVITRFRGQDSLMLSAQNLEPYFLSHHKDEMLLIYEYHNTDSASPISMREKKLKWESRLRIGIAVARAIAETHSRRLDTKPKHTSEIHRDGFSDDLGLQENIVASSIVVPTAGYRPPESDYPSEASDVYAFGILLLELLTGAFPVNDDRMNMVRSVTRKFLELGTLLVFEFVPVKNHTALIQMWKMLLVAILCVDEDPMQRPRSSDVVKMMEGIKRS